MLHDYAWGDASSTTVMSDGAPTLTGGPQAPAPRLTYSWVSPWRSSPATVGLASSASKLPGDLRVTAGIHPHVGEVEALRESARVGEEQRCRQSVGESGAVGRDPGGDHLPGGATGARVEQVVQPVAPGAGTDPGGAQRTAPHVRHADHELRVERMLKADSDGALTRMAQITAGVDDDAGYPGFPQDRRDDVHEVALAHRSHVDHDPRRVSSVLPSLTMSAAQVARPRARSSARTASGTGMREYEASYPRSSRSRPTSGSTAPPVAVTRRS